MSTSKQEGLSRVHLCSDLLSGAASKDLRSFSTLDSFFTKRQKTLAPTVKAAKLKTNETEAAGTAPKGFVKT